MGMCVCVCAIYLFVQFNKNQNFPLIYSSVDESEAIKTVHEAIKKGINFIDTAPWYGHRKSEELLGRELKGIPRRAYYIATKIGRYESDVENMFDFSGKKTRESVKKSLELLGVDSIDVIQVYFYALGSFLEF